MPLMTDRPRPAHFQPPLQLSVEAEGQLFEFGFDPQHMLKRGGGSSGMLPDDPSKGPQAERLSNLAGLENHLVEQFAAKIRADMKPSLTSEASAHAAARELIAKLDPHLRKAMGLPTLH